MTTARTTRSNSTAGGAGGSIAVAAYAQAAGDTMGVFVFWEDDNTTNVTVADTAGNVFTTNTSTLKVQVGVGGAQPAWVQFFYKIGCAGHASNVVTATLPTSASYAHIAVLGILPTGTVTFVDSDTGQQNAGVTPVTGSLTAGQFAFYGCKEYGGVNSTAAGGWTETTDDPSVGAHSFNRIDSPGGTYTGTCNITGSPESASLAISFSDSSTAYTLSAGQASFSLTGQASTLNYSGGTKTLGAGQASYALNGQTATIKRGLKLIAVQGAFAWNGSDAVLDMVITATRGNFALTGQTAGLTYSGGGPKSITAGQGSFTYTGQAAGTRVAHPLTAAQASYAFTGQSAGLTAIRKATAAQGSYTLSGQTVAFTYVHKLAANYGSYLWNTFSVADPPGLATLSHSARFIAGINRLKAQ